MERGEFIEGVVEKEPDLGVYEKGHAVMSGYVTSKAGKSSAGCE